MALRTTLGYESPERWEDAPISDDPLYVWARRTYDLLYEHLTEHADDFFGNQPSAGRAQFMLAFGVEVRQPNGRQTYLERRIALLKQALKEVR
ncbi:MAG: hypothetical protein M3Z33_05535 [Actinomycetota bacterium]|nr:hypothetical protein [Actinomycetota bacterium]